MFNLIFYYLDLSVKTISRQSVSSSEVSFLEGITSHSLTETHSSSTVQTFEMVSTMETCTTSVQSFKVQQHISSVEEYSSKPTLALKLNDLIVCLGDMAQFNCSFTGEPLIEVVWDHNGRTLTNTERVQYMDHEGVLSLIILNVQLTDEGSYRCTVRNANGENRTSARLTVEGAYRFCFISDVHFILVCLMLVHYH